MFDSRFDVFLADTELSRRIHYQIRYRIFCIDTGFEDPTTFQLSEEKDEWDEHSAHFLVREKSTGQWVATMRMVLPCERPFPVEALCNLRTSGQIERQREVSCEISRLCMVKRYRGRQGRAGKQRLALINSTGSAGFDVISSGLNRREEPEIMLGLLRAAFAYSQEQGIRYWYFLITPALARMVSRLGITLEKIGDDVNHRGIRSPYVTDSVHGREESMSNSAEVRQMLTRETPHYLPYSKIKQLKRSNA